MNTSPQTVLGYFQDVLIMIFISLSREVLEPQTNDSNNDNAGDLNQELIKVRSCNLDAMSASENSSMEDLTQSFVRVENSQE